MEYELTSYYLDYGYRLFLFEARSIRLWKH
nr:MAG TPA: hypothetical protein [Caudoviricetes sp.]